MSPQNLYRVLQCAPTATLEEIRSSYRRLARLNHPDRGGSASAFQGLASAYEVLSDPLQRGAYDRDRAAWIAQVGAVACTRCGEANRLGSVPQGQTPCCGLCGHPLPQGQRSRSPLAQQARALVLDVGDRVLQQSSALAVEVGTTVTERTQTLVTDAVDRGFSALRERLGLAPLPRSRR